jgi:gluconate 5-dehydrogenase
LNVWDDLFDLRGKRAIVTGGSSGIGFAIAHALIRAGATVAIVNRDTEAGRRAAAELSLSGGAASSFPADVSREDQVQAVVEAIEEAHGPTDILVNSHGINVRKPALELKLWEWQQIMAINLTGAFLMCQEVGRRMVRRRSGSIVNVSSVVSLVGRKGLSAYSATKGGLSQLTRTLALEWAPYNVRVNAIGPGFIRTPLTRPLFENPGFLEEVERLVPLKRVGLPEDLVGVVMILCSRAGSYITGQTIYIDGGWSIS